MATRKHNEANLRQWHDLDIVRRDYISGITTGSFGGPYASSDDAFVVAINALPAIPEPTSLALVILGATALATCRRR